jgi:glutamate 5-kinase
VQEIDDDLRRLAGGAGSDLGTGGMATKLEAAGIARRAGADVVIAGGREPDVILRAAAGDAVGTRFPALETSLESRKRWILAGAAPGGSITVDAGAARALREKGGSLLPAGITAVDGEFDRGDTVTIAGARGRSLARGIARYSAAELRRIAGCRSDQISDRLGYTSGPVAVHRDDMVVM